VEIQWPAGVRQTSEAPEINHLHTVTEPQKSGGDPQAGR